jgi:hypothetical protein
VSYPRQLKSYNVAIHDPLWIVADGALVDGVANGINDGSGGVAYLLGFDDASSNFVDESRNAFTDAIAANSGVKGATSYFAVAKVFIINGTNLNANSSIAWRTQLKFTTNATPFVTAFTFEYYFKLNPTGDPLSGSGSDMMVLNYGADTIQLRTAPDNLDTSDFHYVRDSSFALFDSSDVIDRDAWHHFCVENKVPGNSPRTLQYYFDGVQVATRVTQFGNNMPGVFLSIANANGGGSKIVSYLDEVRYTKGAYRYGAAFTPNPAVGAAAPNFPSGFIRG